MKKLKWLLIPLIGILIGAGVAWATQNWPIPTIGRIGTTQTIVTWLNGTQVAIFDYGMVENETEAMLPELVRVSNIGSKPVNLTLGSNNWVNITSVVLSWNYTAGTIISSGNNVVVQLNQTVTANYETYGYDTWINATAT